MANESYIYEGAAIPPYYDTETEIYSQQDFPSLDVLESISLAIPTNFAVHTKVALSH